jgi:N-acetylglutamate synthase-like GNAT family acetyltransferase
MSSPTSAIPTGITIRHDIRPGDIGSIVHLHGMIYARDHGFDATFEAYVAEPLARFVRSPSARDRLWIAERDDRIVGCIAIVAVSETEAQLRWYLVVPEERGVGLGKYLVGDAIAFCRQCRYESVFLWTVSTLETAAHLYRAFGFRKVEANPERLWGVDVVEEKYILDL